MGATVNERLKQEIWSLAEPSIIGYGNLIDLLLSAMTEEQLRDTVAALKPDETCPQCGAKATLNSVAQGVKCSECGWESG